MNFSISSLLNYKSLVIVAIALITSFSSFAQTSTEYKAGNEGWLVNLEEAYQLSKDTGKPIMANFTGSDWCGWCKKLTKSVFSKDEFKTWAKDNVILLELDFPRRSKLPEDIAAQNNGLKQAFQVRGFPSVWVFDIDRDPATQQFSINALGKTGYTKTSREFIAGAESMIAKRQ